MEFFQTDGDGEVTFIATRGPGAAVGAISFLFGIQQQTSARVAPGAAGCVAHVLQARGSGFWGAAPAAQTPRLRA